ncbi:MAG: hypothetical protein EOQ60_08645, partial [Mesorhizobium sp.]
RRRQRGSRRVTGRRPSLSLGAPAIHAPGPALPGIPLEGRLPAPPTRNPLPDDGECETLRARRRCI